MIEEKGFSDKRVESALSKIEKSAGKSAQGRLDSFFTIKPKNSNNNSNIKDSNKSTKKTNTTTKDLKDKTVSVKKKKLNKIIDDN